MLLPTHDDCTFYRESCLTEAYAFCQAFLWLILSTYLVMLERNKFMGGPYLFSKRRVHGKNRSNLC